MQRIEAMVPPPLDERIEAHQRTRGFENKSQAIRDLLRNGLQNQEQQTAAEAARG